MERDYNNNSKVSGPSSLIPNTENIHLKYFRDEPIQPNQLPTSIKTLTVSIKSNSNSSSNKNKVKKSNSNTEENQDEEQLQQQQMLLLQLKEKEDQRIREFLKVGSIPNSVDTLEIDYRLFKHNLDIIPSSVTNLTILNFSFNNDDNNNNNNQQLLVPHSVKKLTFVSSNTANLKNVELDIGGKLPSSITELDFGDLFTLIQKSATNRDRGYQFGYKEELPSSIKSIDFGPNFNQPGLEGGMIPEGVRRLVFGTTFNQSIMEGVLPDSLRYLEFKVFNQPLGIGVLPVGLRVLDLGTGFNQPLPLNVIPETVTHLTIGAVNFSINKKLDEDAEEELKEICIPQSVTHLTCSFSILRVGLIPDSVTHLIFTDEIDRMEVGSIPRSVRYLEFKSDINPLLELGHLPIEVETLIFQRDYQLDQSGVGILPTSLTSLSMGKCSNIDLKVGMLPPSLLHLDLGSGFNQEIKEGILPDTLESLTIGSTANLFLKNVRIPTSLRFFNFDCDFILMITISIQSPYLLNLRVSSWDPNAVDTNLYSISTGNFTGSANVFEDSFITYPGSTFIFGNNSITTLYNSVPNTVNINFYTSYNRNNWNSPNTPMCN
eukprot:gene3976-4972_t